MNFLAHAYLSFGYPGILAGNIIGDFIKGRKALDALPAGVQAGVLLHRAIDDFSDKNPAALRAALIFRGDYGRYASPIVDAVMDHFLANDPACFPNAPALKAFSQHCYRTLNTCLPRLPEQFTRMLPYMQDQDWLYNNRSLRGIEQSLIRLHRRAQYMPAPDSAYATLIGHYHVLNQQYLELIEPLKAFARGWLSSNGIDES